MTSQIVFGVVAVGVAIVLFRLLRSGRIREKYAALWILIGVGIILLAAWPGLMVELSHLLGVAVPSNLLFFAAILLLLGVALHLSLEASALEDEVRKLAEHIALIRTELDATRPGAGASASAGEATGGTAGASGRSATASEENETGPSGTGS